MAKSSLVCRENKVLPGAKPLRYTYFNSTFSVVLLLYSHEFDHDHNTGTEVIKTPGQMHLIFDPASCINAHEDPRQLPRKT